MSAFSIGYDASGTLAGLDRLEAAAKTGLRPVAQAAAQVLYEEVKIRAPQSPPGTAHIFTSRQRKGSKKGAKRNKYLYYSGDLKRSVYQAFSEDNSGTSVATYHISWAKNESRSGRAVPYGYMVEYGTSKMPAKPFLRPAYDAKVQEALRAAKDLWVQRTRELIGG